MVMNPEASAVCCLCCVLRFKAFNGWDYREIHECVCEEYNPIVWP